MHKPTQIALAVIAALTATTTAHAADLTVESDTTINNTATYSKVFVNDANLTIGTGGKITFSENSGFMLPGSSGTDATLTFDGGDINFANANARIVIGASSGSKGQIVVNGNSNVHATYLAVSGNAVAHPSGNVDILKIQTSAPAGEAYRRIVLCERWLTYTTKAPTRILFGGDGATLAVGGTNGDMFWTTANSSFVFEGENGTPICFGIGPWWSESATSKKLFSGNGKFQTKGDCEAVFYNHNANRDNSAYRRTFEIALSTNVIAWAHAGATVVSNNCSLKTTARFALPNGPQTGSIQLKGADSRAEPAIDLYGTTQLVNGLFDATPGFKGMVTNSLASAAMLIVGADGGDCDLKIGRVGGDVSFGKVGAGAATVVATNLPAVTVSGGSFIATGCNLKCGGLTQDGGAVGVVSGATFDLSGAAAGSDALSHIAVTDGAGGGTFRGATLAASGVIDLSTATPTAEGFGEDTLAVSFADCANPENIQNWTVRVNGAGGNSLGAKISGGNLRIGKTATVIMMR